MFCVCCVFIQQSKIMKNFASVRRSNGEAREMGGQRAHTEKITENFLCCFFYCGMDFFFFWYYVFVFWHLSEILDAKRGRKKITQKEKRMENFVCDEFIINWSRQTLQKTSRFSRPWDGIVPSKSKWHYKNLIKRLRRVSWFYFKTLSLFHVNICSILLARVMSLRKMHRCVSTSTSNLSQLELI